MNILSVLIACLSYITIIAFCYTLFWGLTRHLFVKLKRYYEIFLGIVLGFISTSSLVLISLLKPNKENIGLTALLPTFLYWVSIIFISPFSSIGIFVSNILNLVLFSSLFPEIFGKPTDWLTIVILSFAYIIPLINYLISKFFKKISNWSNWSITTIILLLIGLSLNFIIIKESIAFVNLTNLLFWLGSGYLAYAFIAIINQTYLHALKLKNIVVYSNKYYLNFSSAHQKILENIQKQKTKHGIYLTYFISNFDKFEKKVSKQINEKIVDSVSEETYEAIKNNFNNVIFFKPNYKTFGAFIPFEMSEDFDKTNNKHLQAINDIFDKITTNFRIDKFKISITIKSVLSYYGIHSSNLDTLAEYNMYVSNDLATIHDQKNIIVNPNEIIKQRYQNKKILTLNEIVNLNEYATLFEPIYSNHTKDFEGYFLDGMISGVEINSNLFEDTFQLISDMGLSTLFIRYTAFQNLKTINRKDISIKHKNIFINYDSYFFSSEEFEVNDFLFKLRKLKINFNKLILNFDLNMDVNNQKILEENIIKLKQKAIKISISNFGSLETDFKLVGLYKPDFIFLENDIVKKIYVIKQNEEIIKESIKIASKLEAKLIATSVNSYFIYKHLRSLGVEFFVGDLIGSSVEPKEVISDELRYLLNK